MNGHRSHGELICGKFSKKNELSKRNREIPIMKLTDFLHKKPGSFMKKSGTTCNIGLVNYEIIYNFAKSNIYHFVVSWMTSPPRK